MCSKSTKTDAGSRTLLQAVNPAISAMKIVVSKNYEQKKSGSEALGWLLCIVLLDEEVRVLTKSASGFPLNR